MSNDNNTSVTAQSHFELGPNEVATAIRHRTHPRIIRADASGQGVHPNLKTCLVKLVGNGLQPLQPAREQALVGLVMAQALLPS